VNKQFEAINKYDFQLVLLGLQSHRRVRNMFILSLFCHFFFVTFLSLFFVTFCHLFCVTLTTSRHRSRLRTAHKHITPAMPPKHDLRKVRAIQQAAEMLDAFMREQRKNDDYIDLCEEEINEAREERAELMHLLQKIVVCECTDVANEAIDVAFKSRLLRDERDCFTVSADDVDEMDSGNRKRVLARLRKLRDTIRERRGRQPGLWDRVDEAEKALARAPVRRRALYQSQVNAASRSLRSKINKRHREVTNAWLHATHLHASWKAYNAEMQGFMDGRMYDDALRLEEPVHAA